MKKLALIMIVASLALWSCSSKHEHPGASAEACDVNCDVASHNHASKEHAGQEHGGTAVAKEHAGQEHSGNAVAKEHAGQEHGGTEHAGTEHAGQEHGGQAAQSYTAAEIKGAMNAHISSREVNGIFNIHDDKTGEDLELKFVKIHDPVRKIEGKGYFACTDFEVVGQAGKLYDLDFWLNPENGTLKITEEKIHKNPIRKGDGWEKKARYTFVNDEPVEID